MIKRDDIYQALLDGKETPEALTFLQERLAKVQATIQKGDSVRLSGATTSTKAFLLQMTPKMVSTFGWGKSTLAEVAAELQEIISEFGDKRTAPVTHSGGQSTTTQTPSGRTLAQVRNEIRRETDPCKRGSLAHEARRMREK
jgi:phage tail sheath gpL-like